MPTSTTQFWPYQAVYSWSRGDGTLTDQSRLWLNALYRTVAMAEGTPGPPGPPGASSSVFYYRIDAQSTAPNDPGAGKIRYNAASQQAATSLYMDILTTDGFDVSILFQVMNPPSRFVIQDKNVSQHYQVWEMRADVISYPDWFEVPVTFVEAGGAGDYQNNTPVAVLVMAEGAPGPPGPTGPPGPAPVFVRETPTGTLNGTNATFTLGFTPAANSLHLYLNGVEQVPTTDYTISSATLTYVVAPKSTDLMIAQYTH